MQENQLIRILYMSKRSRPEEESSTATTTTKSTTITTSKSTQSTNNSEEKEDITEYLASTGERTTFKQAKKEVQWLKPKSKDQTAPRIGQEFQVSLPAFVSKKK